MRIGSLFSGIGGLELGLEWSGLGHVVWQVEKDPYCREVLARHWPDAKRYEDVSNVDATNLEPVDVICGGFPCQDVSGAGKGAGLAGSRSGLWFEFARVVGDLRPRWVIVENVASGAGRWVDAVRRSLEQSGYASIPFPLSARDVGAPHRRSRVFVIAHAVGDTLRIEPERGPGGRTHGVRGQGKTEPVDVGVPRRVTHAKAKQRVATEPTGQGVSGAEHVDPTAADPSGSRLQRPRVQEQQRRSGQHGPGRPGRPWTEDAVPEPSVRRMDDGVPNRTQRLKALGNAVVPQCAEVIGHVILAMGRAST